MQEFRKLIIWQKSMDLTEQIYKITDTFPKEEIFSLTNQIRRCSVSIPSNISEGSGRNTNKDFANFLHISLGSLNELRCQLELSKRLNYISEPEWIKIESRLEILGKMIFNFIKKLKT